MLIVRLKQCEVALRDGRLDEAFELVRQPAVRAHRRGQDLVARLSRALLERGRTHLASGQLLPAAHDCEKAAQLAGNLPDVAQLRTAVSHAMDEQRRAQQNQQQILATARRHLEQGQLTVGEHLLGTATLPAEQVATLRQDIQARRSAIASAIEKATKAYDAGDWESAVDHLVRLDRTCQGDSKVRDLAGKISSFVTRQTTDAIEAGRLDRAGALLARLERIPGSCVEADQLRQTLRQCRRAMECLEKSDFAGADQVVRTLAPLWPNARWLQDASEQIRNLRDSADAVRTGPLRLLAIGSAMAPTMTTKREAPHADRSPGPDVILHVDGVGGFRVVTRPVVTIGPLSGSRPVDVPLLADAALPVVTITRSDEDYFLQSRQPVLVNDTPVTNKLLAHGDRIMLGSRCRLTFRRPSAASTSAVIDLGGTRMPRGDVRHVILLDRELIVGPGSSAHVRCDDMPASAVICRRDGQLVCRMGSLLTELAPGAHVPIGPIGLAVAKEE